MKNTVQSPGPVTIDQRSDEWRDLAEAIGIDLNLHAQFTVRDVIDEARKLKERVGELEYELNGVITSANCGVIIIRKRNAEIAKLKGDIEQLKGTAT